VDEPEISIDPARRSLRIVIQVQEGPQYRIGEIGIKGVGLLSETDIRGLMKSQSGGVFSREGLQGDVVAITDRYADRGYLFAEVVPVTDVLRDSQTVKVSMEIVEGRQAFINRVEIGGNIRTRDKVIRRMIPLVEGDVFSGSGVQQARRNLDSLGYFEEVKLDTRRTAEADKVDLVVDVREKSTGSFTLGGGFSSVDGGIGVASISQTNLFGLGKRASISGQVGQHANRYNVVYTDPNFWDTNFLIEPRAYSTQTRYRNTQGYNVDTLGGSFSVGHMLVERVNGMLTYGYENIALKDVDAAAPYVILRQANESGGESTTSSLTGALTRDTRDSGTEPTKGSRIRLAYQYAGGFLGADNYFTKVSAEASQHWPLWWKLVGHLRGSFLYGDSFGHTPILPVQERFYLGGTNTIRGFRSLTISPRDAVGGEGLTGGSKAYYVNSELLFPLMEQMRMRGVVFFDFGNNLDERNSIGDLFQRTRMGAGIGIRFISPIGAMRLEWGFNLNPEPGEKMQVLHFTAGTTF
jgi:outer membrane protein insertion porin family